MQSLNDLAYAKRIIKEVVRIRLNINALINAVLDETGIIVTITDTQHDLVWVMGDPLGKILIDRPHCQPIIYVNAPPGTTPAQMAQIQTVIERNRMTGIMPIYQIPNEVVLTGTYRVLSSNQFQLIGVYKVI